MVSFQISPPKNSSFTRPEEWPRWIKYFEYHRQASNLSKKIEMNRVNTLDYAMGCWAEDIKTFFVFQRMMERNIQSSKRSLKIISLNAIVKFMREQGLTKGINYLESHQTILSYHSIA